MMRSSLKKKLVLVVLATVAFLGWMALQPQPAQAEPFCSNYGGKPCWTEGDGFFCYNTGCPSWTLWAGSCSCQNGRWSCTPDTPCGGNTSVVGGGDTAFAAQSPALPGDFQSVGELWLTKRCE
jgi:hypothetical protein